MFGWLFHAWLSTLTVQQAFNHDDSRLQLTADIMIILLYKKSENNIYIN